MFEMLPFAKQPYNDNVFKIITCKLVDQAPCVVSWIMDSIVSNLSSRTTPTYLKDLLPTYQATLEKGEINIRYPYEKKVSYFWIFKKLIQLLLWNESSPAKDMKYFDHPYKIFIEQVNENIPKALQVISDYTSHRTSNSVLLGFNNHHPVESSALPSYQNVISDHDIVGTSNSNLNTCTQQNGNLSETIGRSREHGTNNPFTELRLQYCFDGSNRLQARDFINDYDCLALRNRWSSEQKHEFFSKNLEKDALEWYLSNDISSLTSWKALRNEFMRKYLID